MESNSPLSAIAKKLLHIFRVVFYMLRKGISKNKIMMEIHFLLKRSKLIGKALSNRMTFQHNNHSSQNFSSAYSSFSCRSMEPNLSFYNPQEVEFSFSNTPSYPSFIAKRKNHHCKNYSYDYEAVAAISRAFEMMNKNSNNNNNEIVSDAEESVAQSPMVGLIGKSTPMTVRQLRITDSPFPIIEDEAANDGRVDKEAAEFINRFYEQLRMQQSKSKGIRRG